MNNFQFHKGTIKPPCCIVMLRPVLTFNSIKVQLSQGDRVAKAGAISFQFHKGTIKPVGDIRFCSGKSPFNSIKVQLSLMPFSF